MTSLTLRLLAASALLTLPAAALADGHFERTLSVGPSPDLYVLTGSGNVLVHAGAPGQLRIAAHIHSSWSLFGATDDPQLLQRIESDPPIVQQGNTIRVGDPTGHEGINHVSIDYDIIAPAGVALNLRSGSGDITTQGVGRFLQAVTGSGNLHAQGLGGPADLASGSGDITLDELASGDIKARTGSGNIRIHGLNGGLAARAGSGDIEADGHLAGPATLSSGSGNVHLHLGPGARFNLEASTGSGHIRVAYPGAPEQDDHSRHHLTAPINGGGPALEVRTGSGDVEVDPGSHAANTGPASLHLPAARDCTEAPGNPHGRAA